MPRNSLSKVARWEATLESGEAAPKQRPSAGCPTLRGLPEGAQNWKGPLPPLLSLQRPLPTKFNTVPAGKGDVLGSTSVI